MEDKFLASLIAARLNQIPLPHLSEKEQPGDLSQGYKLQVELNRRLIEAGQGPMAGYKIGCTTPVMQEYLGIPHPCYGEVFQSRTLSSPAILRHGDFIRPGVECEIAVVLASDMDPSRQDYDKDNVAKFVGSCHAAIEVVDDRYENYSELAVATLIADNFFNAAEVLGPANLSWRDLDLMKIKGEMRINDASVGEGDGAMILGHPFTALAWLANEMAASGAALKAGQFVSLGSVVKTVWIDNPGTKVEVVFEGLGRADLLFE